jgi:hypothetical protein
MPFASSAALTCLVKPRTSTSARPHDGHATRSSPRLRSPSALGPNDHGAMPSASNAPIPTAPCYARGIGPASVTRVQRIVASRAVGTPRSSRAGSSASRNLDIEEVLQDASFNADRPAPQAWVAVLRASFERPRVDPDADQDAARLRLARISALCPGTDVAGIEAALIPPRAQPSRTSLKWMSATTGTVDLAAIAVSASASSQ